MKYAKGVMRRRFNRFLLVGAGNTTINFIVLNFAYSLLHLNKLIASVIATSCAIVFSFAFNRTFVFKDNSQPLKKLVHFTAVSAIGTLLIQTSIYALFLYILSKYNWGNSLVRVNVSNVIASVGILLWNYNGYRLLVFKGSKREIHINDGLKESKADEIA